MNKEGVFGVKMFKNGVKDMVKELKSRFKRVAELYIEWKDRKEMKKFQNMIESFDKSDAYMSW